MTSSPVTDVPVDDFVETLRAHSRRYHDQHPFHVRMNAGRLSRRQIQGWVANRFYYQENIPRKDAAILSNCPDVEVRRPRPRRLDRPANSYIRRTSPGAVVPVRPPA